MTSAEKQVLAHAFVQYLRRHQWMVWGPPHMAMPLEEPTDPREKRKLQLRKEREEEAQLDEIIRHFAQETG